MDWDKLKVFHAAAEAGSFTHAGEQLGLSQSAVSRQVSALEQELSVSLFHRHARGLILTEQGDLLFRTAHDVFMQLQAARAKLTDSRERPSGDLKVTTTPGVGINWLIPRLGEFTALYPEIRISLIVTDEDLDLSMREADVAIRTRKPTQPDLIQRKLFAGMREAPRFRRCVKYFQLVPIHVLKPVPCSTHLHSIHSAAARSLARNARKRSASRAAMQPRPAAVTACR